MEYEAQSEHLRENCARDNQIDQVKRKDAFLAAHPEWAIAAVREGKFSPIRFFQAIKETEDGEITVTRYTLRSLLDQLMQIEEEPQE